MKKTSLKASSVSDLRAKNVDFEKRLSCLKERIKDLRGCL